jgi:hypothetical protein
MHGNVTPRGYGDLHEVAPRRWSHLPQLAALLLIVLGDAVAFVQVAEAALPDLEEYKVVPLIVALSAAATVSMHLAGASAKARRANADHVGNFWFLFVILGWLALGAVAFWFRLAAAAADATPAGTGNGFGTVAAATPHVPVAALMFGLYLVGGMTAYGIGYRTHNPARSAYFRALAEHRRAEDAHRRAVRRHVKAVTAGTQDELRNLQRDADAASHGLHGGGVGTADPREDSNPPMAVDIADELAQRRERGRQQVEAQAEQLRQLARHRLAVALADPARSSGVFSASSAPANRQEGLEAIRRDSERDGEYASRPDSEHVSRPDNEHVGGHDSERVGTNSGHHSSHVGGHDSETTQGDPA